MEASDYGLITIGVNVDIQRSDGRMHSAVVSGVKAGEVTVEWFENGETKGKEIDIDSIFLLNEHLRGPQEEPPAKKHSTRRRTGSNPTNRSEKENLQNIARTSIPKRDISSAKSRRSYAGRPAMARGDHKEVSGACATPVIPAENPVLVEFKKPNTRRKSSCVKVVEKIKQKRDVRRATQVSIRESNNQQYDTSHPQWEFLAMIEDYRTTLDYKPMSNSEPLETHQICVCVRKRPLGKKELSKREVDVITVPNKATLIVHEPKTKVDLTKYLENQTFRFDYAFDEAATNEMVYRYTAKPLVECIFDRGMATCFAYGQTGSGKTHTMGGDFSGKGQQDTTKGIYALAAQDLFTLLRTKYSKMDLVASASFFEIYSGKVFDLLNAKQKLRVLEDGKQQVQVVGLKEEMIAREDSVIQLIQHGNKVRTSGQTSANQHSSRSHAVFQLILRKKSNGKLHGKFSLIDLAGNERGADTMSSDRNTRLEGAEINKSLLGLKECIRALRYNGTHLPFRASKLTQVLRDSFIGEKSRTCMIAMISPGFNCCEHTLNTLRYADRVKELGPGTVNQGAAAAPVNMESDEGLVCMSPQSRDLAMIRESNGEELTDEFLNFHAAIDITQELEEEVIQEHSKINQKENQWKARSLRLHAMAEGVEYDVEGYTNGLKELINEKIAAYNSLGDKLAQWQRGMENEESVCQTLKSKKK